MGYHLYREVKRHAPSDLDTGELALLLILADEANDETRECFPGMDELCAYMRMSADGIGKVLQRLAKRGIDVRVPVGKDKTGRAIYAMKGVRTTYQLPKFAPTMPVPQYGQSANAQTPVRPKTDSRPDAGTPISGVWPDAGTSMPGPQSGPSPHIPQEEEPHLSVAQRVLRTAALGLTEDEEKKLIDWTNRQDRKGPAWWRTLAANGDLPDLVASWREHAVTAAAVFGDTPPPWCGECGDGSSNARFNPRLRTDTGLPGGQPCPRCHPDRARHPPSQSATARAIAQVDIAGEEASRIIAAARAAAAAEHPPPRPGPYQNPVDQSVYLKPIS